MEFRLQFDMDNAAFEGNLANESSGILARVSHKIAYSADPLHAGGPIRDSNGNTVGRWEVLTDYELRVRELEAEGLTRSDAHGVADTEGLDDG